MLSGHILNTLMFVTGSLYTGHHLRDISGLMPPENKLSGTTQLSRRLNKIPYTYTVEPQFNEPLFNEHLDITNGTLCPSNSKI